MPHDRTIRTARPADYDTIVAVVDGWWQRPIGRDLQRLFLDHFHATSLIAEGDDGALAGFVIGFHSPSDVGCAYIHFTGVAPEHRRTGLARDLYERFFATARAAGCTRAKAVTSSANTRSIAFHQAIGFSATEPIPDYDGPEHDRVVFHRAL